MYLSFACSVNVYLSFILFYNSIHEFIKPARIKVNVFPEPVGASITVNKPGSSLEIFVFISVFINFSKIENIISN